jgi:hypothetical protein
MRHNATQDIEPQLLTSKQERGVDALLMGKSVSQVAKTLGIDRSTVHRSLVQPEFVATLNGRRLALREAGQARLEQLQATAIETVEALVEQGNGRIALAVLKGTGLLSGKPSIIGPTDPTGVRREQAAKENEDRLTDLINAMAP